MDAEAVLLLVQALEARLRADRTQAAMHPAVDLVGVTHRSRR